MNDDVTVNKKLSVKELSVDGSFSFKSAVFDTPATFSNDVSLKNASVSDNLAVHKDVIVGGTITADRVNTNIFSFKNGMFEVDTEFQKNVDVKGKLTADSIETKNMYFDNSVFNNETFFNKTMNANTINTENLSVTKDFTTHGDIYTSGEITGRDGIFYKLSSIGKTELKDDVNITGAVDVGGESRFRGDLVVSGNVSTYKNANVSNVYASGEVSTDTLKTSDNIDVNGAALFRKNVTVDGDMTIKGLVTGGNNVPTSFGSLVVTNKADINELFVGTKFECQDVLCRDVKQVSDERFKKNITEHEPKKILDKVCSLRPVNFTWKHDDKDDIGLVAQDVRRIFPELVHDNGEILSVKYANIVSLLISCVKELKKEINELRENQ
jgi:cytoskeletal protein CcmA (bactofilin family)